MTSSYVLFEQTLENLKVSNYEEISSRRKEITKALNREFRDSDSQTDNALMVGSCGRHTAIDGISDLDMVYVMPRALYDDYHKQGGSRRAFERAKKGVSAHYSTSDIRVDHQVVVLQFTNFKFEIQPVFEADDGSFEYPDTYSDSWHTTKPRLEIGAMKELNDRTEGNARVLCRLTRAWKHKHNVEMGGLLIDTLVWRFFGQTDWYQEKTTLPDYMLRDFFKFLSDLPKQDSWNAVGSNQKVYVKKNFQNKAKKAYGLCLDAIEADGDSSMYSKWRKVLGRFVPVDGSSSRASSEETFKDTEEFIEDYYDMDLRYTLEIDCTVTQDGFRPASLRDMLVRHIWLRPNKKLEFKVSNTTVPAPFDLRWKVLNRGSEAERRDDVRGQIIKGSLRMGHVEHTKFRGDHYVECYAIKDGRVVAREHQEVPIQES